MTFRYVGNGPPDWQEQACAESLSVYPGKEADATAVAGFLIEDPELFAGRVDETIACGDVAGEATWKMDAVRELQRSASREGAAAN
jgi:hypothetical protein